MVVFCMALLETSGFWDADGINAVRGMAVTMLEKLTQVLSDGQWHSTAELVEQVGHRFSAI